MMRLVSLTLISVLLASVTASPAPSPVRFMCDVCEGNFLSCMVHCSLERFITRDQFDRWILILKYWIQSTLDLFRPKSLFNCPYRSFIISAIMFTWGFRTTGPSPSLNTRG